MSPRQAVTPLVDTAHHHWHLHPVRLLAGLTIVVGGFLSLIGAI